MMKGIVLILFACLTFSMNAYAKDMWEMAESDVWKEKAGPMLGRGLLNVVTSPIDMPVQLVKGAKEKDPAIMGGIGGFATGAACTVLRAASGIVDVAFFWAPSFNGVPVSRSYENCLESSPSYGSAAPSRAVRYTPPPTPAPVRRAPPPPAPRAVVTPPPAPQKAPTPVKEDPKKYIKK